MNPRALKILCVGLGLCAATGNLAGQVTLTNLHSFSSSGDGYRPKAGLVQGGDGFFYGTTLSGGLNNTYNFGTVFRISAGGSYTVLYSFGTFVQDGNGPIAGLVEGSPGNFYGTTSGGGTNTGAVGTVFQLNTDGNLATILYSFSSLNGDGRDPVAALILGNDGNFYGTTKIGGTNDVGTAFQITAKGDLTIMHSFGSGSDGYYPTAGLVQGTDSNFFGTTDQGGTNNSGTVFRISPGGSYTNLYSLTGQGTGNQQATLVQGSDGNFYGTTEQGGTNSIGLGTVFRISPSGGYTNLHSFDSLNGDGYRPTAGLVQGSDGNFYGLTSEGGTNGGIGTLFRISPSGIYADLYTFGDNSTRYGLVQGSDGNFYGTTFNGGTNGLGSVFKLVVPLNAPANQISAVQVVGTNVLVTIPSVAAETYQLQYRDSLTAGAWSNVAGAFAKSLGGPLTMTNFGGVSPSQRFYRFAITP